MHRKMKRGEAPQERHTHRKQFEETREGEGEGLKTTMKKTHTKKNDAREGR